MHRLKQVLVISAALCVLPGAILADTTAFPTARPSFVSQSGSSHVPRPHGRPAYGGALLSFEDAALYRGAFAAARRYQWKEARSKAAQAKNPVLAKVIEWLYFRARTNNEPFERTATFLDTHVHWPGMELVRHRAERQITGNEGDAVLNQWFAVHPPLTAKGREQLALLQRRQGKGGQAAALIREIWLENNLSAADEKKFFAAHDRLLRQSDHQARLDRLLWDRKSEAAARQLERVVGEYKKLGRARLALIRSEKGVDYHIERVPASLHNDPGLLYERARFRRKKNRNDDAAELLLNYSGSLDAFGRPDQVWIERRILGRHFIKTKDYEKAYKITAQHGLVPGGDFADAEFLAGWLSLYHLDKPVQAARHFRRLFENVKRPISIARATFWLAETANRLGRADTAVTWYVKAAKHPDTYYGQLAQDRISAQTGLAPPPRQLTQANASKAPTKANELVTVVRYLDSVGENKLVGRFLHHMRQTAETSADFESLAGLAKSINRPDLMLRIAREASWQHVSLPDAAYPVDVTPGYGNMSEAVALLPEEALIYAIQRQESAFKVDAKSHAGARGLMQLMPGTARLVAKNIGITYRPEGLLNDPAYNLLLGASYLSQMIERFDGSYILAIAAYNAGPHRVDRWLKDYGDPRTDEISAIDWVEHIPFTETRNYVQRVTEAILPYRSRLGSAQGDQSLIAILSRHTMPGSEVANAD